MDSKKIKTKIYMLEYIDSIINMLQDRERSVLYSYEVTGTTTNQRKHWKTGELLWLDEEKTQPDYEKEYDYVLKDTLSEEDDQRLEALSDILRALEKLV